MYTVRAASLMDKLGEKELAKKIRRRTSLLKANYKKTFYDPNTGWIANWRSKDGKLHNYGNLAHTGAAITCGVIDPAEGKQMLENLLEKLKDIGFSSYQYGLPANMLPVKRDEYAFGYGTPLEPDGSDMQQVYMNGSATAGQCFWFLDALYKCDMRKQANEILKKMCYGYYTGQMCGPLNSGLDWRGWDGRPAGYEGLLSDMFHPLQAVLTGYLGWEYTLNGLKTAKGSAADFLMHTRKVNPDFGQVLK